MVHRLLGRWLKTGGKYVTRPPVTIITLHGEWAGDESDHETTLVRTFRQDERISFYFNPPGTIPSEIQNARSREVGGGYGRHHGKPPDDDMCEESLPSDATARHLFTHEHKWSLVQARILRWTTSQRRNHETTL